jgi:NSS family neurotransmitter:Na+ symporter
MAGGGVWALLFFVGFFFAAFTSAVLVAEVSTTTLTEETGWSREATVFGVCGLIWLLGLPSAVSGSVLGFLDFVFGNFGLPLATLAIVGTIGWALTPEKLRVLEVNRGAGLYVGPRWNPIVRYLIPVVMVGIVLNYAVTNLGSTRMIAGVAVFVLFPVIGALLARALPGGRSPD